MKSNTEKFARSRKELSRMGDRRVWSVIVTLLGDLAQGPNDRITGPLLARLAELLEIKPEAMRVALHRLRKDGWIISGKIGRTSVHQLSEHGRIQSQEANQRIYGPTRRWPNQWYVALAKPRSSGAGTVNSSGVIADGYIGLGQGAYLGIGSPGPDSDGMLVLQGRELKVPQWLLDDITSGKQRSVFELMFDAMETVNNILDQTGRLSNLETAALRTLIVHYWRVLVLRSPDLPPALFPSDWKEPECRILFRQTLERLTRPSLKQLQQTVE